MKIKEPIKRKCPHCRNQLEFSLDWIMHEGQACSFCHHSLEDVRSGIKHWLDELGDQIRIFGNITETAMAVEDKFSICFDDEDLYRNEYETTVSDIIESANQLLNSTETTINHDELTARILEIVRNEFRNESVEIEPQTKFSELNRNREIQI